MSEMLTLGANLQVDRQGLTARTEIDISRVPLTSRKELLQYHEKVQQALEAVTIPWPNRELRPQDTWRMMRPLPIDRPGRFDSGAMDMTYTYLGTRMRDGRQEALVGMSGQVKARAGLDTGVAGWAEGTAVLDLTAGTVSQVDAKVFLDINTVYRERPGRANGILEVKFQRDVKGLR
jgi:hypothetical protein